MNLADYHVVTLAALLHDLGKLIRCQPQIVQQQKPYGRATRQNGFYGHDRDSTAFLRHCGATALAQWPQLADLIDQHHKHDWLPLNQPLGWLVSKADHFSSKERLDEESTKDSPGLESIFQQVQTIYPKPATLHYYQARALSAWSSVPATNAPQFNAFERIVDTVEAETRSLLTTVQAPDHLIVAFTDLLERFATMTSANKGSRPRDISLYDHLSTSAAIAACLYLWHAGTNQWDEATLKDESTEKFLLIGGDLSGIQDYLYEIARIGEGGVARRLRARSFYLTALQDVIAFRLCQELVGHLTASLPMNCQLINTGGRFLILAPNLPEVQAKLAELDSKINGWLRSETHGDLACVFAALPLSGQDFVPDAKYDPDDAPSGSSNITRKIDELYQLLNMAKTQRYYRLLHNDEGWQATFVERANHVHYPAGDGRNRGGACRSCNKLPVEAAEQGDGVDLLCFRCRQDVELGRRLINARYLGFRQGVPTVALPTLHGHSTTAPLDINFFGDGERYTVRVASRPLDLADFGAGYVEFLESDQSTFVDPTSYDRQQAEATDVGYRYPLRRRRLANYVPTQPVNGTENAATQEIVPFGDLAERSGREADRGKVEPLLGIVKLDVDQLGLLIADGLGAVTSISRVATFSRMVDLFFSGWVDTRLRQPYPVDSRGRALATEPNPYRDVYTVYAGGDDLLLVAPWDRAVEVAQTLQADFHAYTCGNPNLTVSASVYVIKPRFPVAKGAQEATALLEGRAKAGGRNRFHLFGITVPWYHRTPEPSRDPTEQALRNAQIDSAGMALPTLWQEAEFFDEQLQRYRQSLNATGATYPVSNSLLHKILRLSLLSRRLYGGQPSHINDLTYMARLAYQIGRNVTRHHFGDYEADYDNVLQRLMRLTQLQNVGLMAHLQMPLTWALYRNRRAGDRSNETRDTRDETGIDELA